eukprot:2115659-Ditylum_brightwellii.AAC.1
MGKLSITLPGCTKGPRKTGVLTIQDKMNQEQMVNVISEDIQQAINLNDKKDQQEQTINMVKIKDKFFYRN